MTKLLIAIAITLATAFSARADPLVTYPLWIGTHRLRVEVASTQEERQVGLMHRKSLGENQGMVFVFERAGVWGMWMKNTYVPLSVAFIAEDGRILNIEDMEPLSEDSHSANGPAKYALETNKGWFKKRGIKAGQRVQGLKEIPRAQ